MTRTEKRKAMGLCIKCGKNPPRENKTTCEICAKRQKKHYEKHKEERREHDRKYYKEHLEEHKERNKKYLNQLRAKVIKAYGSKCICCGESNKRFLTIDHINNDGAVRRKEMKAGANFYKKIISSGFPDDLQLLCYNCNCGRACNGGICPHKEQEKV